MLKNVDGILVEVDERAGADGLVPAGGIVAPIPKLADATEAFDAIVTKARVMVSGAVKKSTTTPVEVTLKLGVKFEAEAGLPYLTKAGAEASLVIELKWTEG